jgi:hypothetical protein
VPADLPRALAWAVYLGVSWTWVIGMFLPVLLIRDFGPASWFIFAIPNVLGAAAMGWVLKSREHTFRLITQHRGATQAFSVVTIAFHLFFIVWMVSQFVGVVAASLVFGAGLVVMVPLLVTSLQQTLTAMLAFGASLVIAFLAGGGGSLHWPGEFVNRQTPFDLFALGSVCALGFLTCPYLDLTFHRARQACRSMPESKIAFGVGFGAVFFSMIVLTLLYAGGVLGGDVTLLRLVGIHISIQAIFTIGVHASALRASASTPSEHRRLNTWLWIAGIGAAVVAIASRHAESRGVMIHQMRAGEVAYRLFMSFYGLLAPAYVWLCVHPGRGFMKPHRRELQMFGVAVVLATPFYWMGFIHGPMQWVVPGVLIIVGARFLLDYTRRDLLAEHRATMVTPGDRR